MHMGGAKERIDVKMIAHPDQDQKEAHEELSRQFASFNAKDAQCSKQEDRQKLLAVIEAAFGDYKEFNRDVRHVFASRVSRDSGDSPGSRVGSSSFISRLRSHARVLTWSLWQAAPRPPRRRTGFFDTLSGAHRRWASDERCAGLRAKGRARACECADTTKITPRQNMGAARYEIAARVSRAVFNVTSLMEQDKWCVRQLTQGRGEARARSRCGSPEMWIRNLWEWG